MIQRRDLSRRHRRDAPGSFSGFTRALQFGELLLMLVLIFIFMLVLLFIYNLE